MGHVMDHTKTTRYRILELFYTPDLVLRPSEIIRRTGLKAETVRTMLKRMVHEKQLYHLRHSQYARSASAPPLTYSRDVLETRVRALEARITELEQCLKR